MKVKEALGILKYYNEQPYFFSRDRSAAIAFEMAIEALEKQRNENYIKIVRCKDCSVPHNKYTGCPKLNGLVTLPDFYCGWGVPKITEEILCDG